jgi:hypothetical protein
MSIAYVNEAIGRRCTACRKGIIFYYNRNEKSGQLEVIGCTNEKCKGHVAIE